MTKSRHVILMADVITSGEHDGRTLSRHLKRIIAMANRTHARQLRSPLTVTLGDEFQGVTRSVAGATEIILWLEHRLRSKPLKENGELTPYRLRYVVHEGGIESALNPERAHGMLGPGLTRARALLNRKTRDQPRVKIEIDDHRLARRLHLGFAVWDELGAEFKAEDYAFIELALTEPDAARIGRKVGRHRTSVERRRRNLKLNAFQATESLIRDLVAKG